MPARLTQMDFSIMSPDMIKNLARVRVVNSDLYDADGYPVEGGVMDPRLGVIDPGLHCRTCGGSIGDCPGHFGYLELAKPVINVLYIKNVYQLLKHTCRKCNRIMPDSPEKFKKSIAPLKCPHCKAKQRKITFVKPYSFYENKAELRPTDIRERFEKIPAKDLKAVGIGGGRPDWLILTLFPIPPVTMRPSITLETGERSEDDLTHKLVDIVRINQSLKENIDIGAPEFILNDLWELVQYHISTYFDNELTGAPLARHRSGRPLKGLVQRLKAKEGRIRGNLLGKRVNFSARTVIVPDPKISINEVGVPEEIANELTIPVKVTEINMKYVKDLIKMEQVNYVIRPDGRRLKLTSENKKDLLENIDVDWSVDRQLEDGDVVLFNRQPSLHRVSMMAHRVRRMPFRAFRMNPSVCFPYNADFDGDEMNLHAPQTEEARTEASMLMEVKNNIISPRFGGPLVGMDLDQVSGVYMLTAKDVSLNREEAAQLFAAAGIDIDIPEKPKFTGKELFSMLLPEELDIEFAARCGKPYDTVEEKRKHDGWVIIRKGKLVEGRMDKAGLGTEEGKVIGKLAKIWEPEQLRDFLDNCGRLGNAFISRRGFSLGVSDLDLDTRAMNSIHEEIENAKKSANKLISDYRKGTIDILPGMTPQQSLEAQVMNTLANGVSKVSEIVSKNMPQNDIINMAMSGAKGSLINLTQMAAVVGQETILGKRIRRGYRKRTLPHMKRNDLSPGSRGFVARGFKQGLTPFEVFWNIMNGREGLMDKSLRTRKSGYMQRRLVNALQDMKVYGDYSVRNATGEIVQFVAGEDRIDVSKSDFGKFNWKEALGLHIKEKEGPRLSAARAEGT